MLSPIFDLVFPFIEDAVTLLSDDTYDNKVTQSEKEAKQMITQNLMNGLINPVSQQNSNESRNSRNSKANSNSNNSNNNKNMNLPGKGRIEEEWLKRNNGGFI